MSMEDEVKELLYAPILPVDILFNKNKFCVHISKLADRDVSTQRLGQHSLPSFPIYLFTFSFTIYVFF